jgi:hypothetical protein
MSEVARETIVWRTVETAPVGKIVLTAGGGYPRFMRLDEHGQWRSMTGRPKPAPMAWAKIPTPKITKG